MTHIVSTPGYRTVDEHHYLRAEVVAWMEEHGVTRFNCACDLIPYTSGHLKTVDFAFQDANHALMFKLRWGGDDV